MDLFTNFADSVLYVYAEAFDDFITVRPGDISLFPDISVSGTFRLVLYDNISPPEIVIVTATADNVFTCTRGAEGTSARGWNAGTLITLEPTAEFFNSIEDRLAAAEAAILELESTIPTGVEDGAFLFCAAVLL